MNRQRVLIAAIVCCFLLDNSSRGENATISEDVAIQPAKSSFIYGEPVVMYVMLSNSSPSVIKIYTELQNGVGADYDMMQSNGVFTSIAAGFYRDPVGHTHYLAPYDMFRHFEIFCYDWRQKQPLFQIGTNYVGIHYRRKKSTSGPFVVVRPETQADIASSQIMINPEVMEAIALKNVSEVRNALKTVVEQDSSLSPYAAFFLGAYYGGSETLEEKDLMLTIADQEGFPLQEKIVQIKDAMRQDQLEAQVRVEPEVLKVSPGILTVFVRLPEGYSVANIVSAACDGALPQKMMLSDDKTEMIMKFRRQDIEAALARLGESLDTTFVVRGTWKGGAKGTKWFMGTASIKKIVGAKDEDKDKHEDKDKGKDKDKDDDKGKDTDKKK